MLDYLFKRTEHLVQQSDKRMLKKMLKPFKRTFTQHCEVRNKYLLLTEFEVSTERQKTRIRNFTVRTNKTRLVTLHTARATEI